MEPQNTKTSKICGKMEKTKLLNSFFICYSLQNVQQKKQGETLKKTFRFSRVLMSLINITFSKPAAIFPAFSSQPIRIVFYIHGCLSRQPPFSTSPSWTNAFVIISIQTRTSSFCGPSSSHQHAGRHRLRASPPKAMDLFSAHPLYHKEIFLFSCS